MISTVWGGFVKRNYAACPNGCKRDLIFVQNWDSPGHLPRADPIMLALFSLEQEVGCIEIAQGHVQQRDGIAGVIINQDIAADLGHIVAGKVAEA